MFTHHYGDASWMEKFIRLLKKGVSSVTALITIFNYLYV